MFIINVVNKRKHKSTSHDFYCGRPSPLGNPFSHLTTGTLAKFVVGSREESITKHKEYFLEELKKDGKVKGEFLKIWKHVMEHGTANLICFCAPQSCHCDNIKEELLNQL